LKIERAVSFQRFPRGFILCEGTVRALVKTACVKTMQGVCLSNDASRQLHD